MGEVLSEDIVRYIAELRGGRELLDTQLGAVIQAYLLYGIVDAKRREVEIDRVQQMATNTSVDREEVKSAKRIAACFQWLGDAHDITPYLYKKIELAQPFVEPS
jgi:hypothetical protein